MRKGWKRVHRLVVLPDYQGVGIGTSFIQKNSRSNYKRRFSTESNDLYACIDKGFIKEQTLGFMSIWES
nr:MAG TPA: NAT, N-acetyltransferase, of N-acetylglutamate synthase [Caudoviricetes sp.]